MAIGDVDPHKPLRDDVRLLGDLLGETLTQAEGRPFLDTVERVRGLAKAARAEGADHARDLARVLSALPADAAAPLARAFSHFLNLANVAEQHHRIRRRRAYLRDAEAPPQRGSVQDTFSRLIGAGIKADALHGAMASLRIELVLTAHPTEVSRRTM